MSIEAVIALLGSEPCRCGHMASFLFGIAANALLFLCRAVATISKSKEFSYPVVGCVSLP